MTQQEYASHMQSETVETLHRFNQTFQFLLGVSENSRDQLNWILGVVQKIGQSCFLLFISFKTWSWLTGYITLQRVKWVNCRRGSFMYATSCSECCCCLSSRPRLTRDGSSFFWFLLIWQWTCSKASPWSCRLSSLYSSSRLPVNNNFKNVLQELIISLACFYFNRSLQNVSAHQRPLPSDCYE